jgi:hypothetical protein
MAIDCPGFDPNILLQIGSCEAAVLSYHNKNCTQTKKIKKNKKFQIFQKDNGKSIKR